MGNPLKLAALHWAYPSVHGVRIQIPWDENQPQYGKYHYAFSKGTLTQIIAYTEANCAARDRWGIEAWMKGRNPTDLHVGIDCSGFVYRVMDEAAQRSGAPSLASTLGRACEYTTIDQLTPSGTELHRAIDVQSGDAMRFNKGRHSGVIIETVFDGTGRLREIWYAHSSFTRGPHIGWIEVGDPWAPINNRAQNWHDEMWDGLKDNNLRDLYFTSIHRSHYYRGARPRSTKVEGVSIAVAGQQLRFTVPPFTLNGRTFSQVRPLAEAMGAVVSWDDASQMVTLQRGAYKAQCQVGSEVGIVNGEPYLLDEPPIFMGQSTVVVPVRFVCEALGFEVSWDQAAQQVNLVRK